MASALAQYVIKYINQTNRSVFLTGKAGTGKTTLLKEIINGTHKNAVVVAPTGIAALNAGGVTIHSMFQLPFGAFIPNETDSPQFTERYKFENRQSLARHFKMNGVRQAVIRNMELLIIDEVSMLRADLLDAVDFMLQRIRRNSQAFGGVQVLFIGDLLQLPPIVKPEEWQILSAYYKSVFFFDAVVVRTNPLVHIELDKIYRQQDEKFIRILNNLRNNVVTAEDVLALNEYYKPDFDISSSEGYITLTTHNTEADTKNAAALAELDGREYSFKPEIVGDFPDRIFPLENDLKLKVGAQVMFIKNDISGEKKFYNGKIGLVKSLEEGQVVVEFTEDRNTITVDKYEWKNIRYTVNDATKDVEEDTLGTYVQYPIKLAWAITVHKSQGLTFDKAILDVSRAFAPGQAYVALSRLRSLQGLVLLKQFPSLGIPSDNNVKEYAKTKTPEEVLENDLSAETRKYLMERLISCFNFEVLCQQWRNHKYSYDLELPNSPKRKFQPWMDEQFKKVYDLLEPSRKFGNLLRTILGQENPDYNHLKERCETAFKYFSDVLYPVHYELALKIEEVVRTKRMKAFYEELSLVDDVTTETVLGLYKSKIWLEAIINAKEITKDVLQTSEVRNYKKNLILQVKEDFKSTCLILGEEDEGYYNSPSKKKKASAQKKSTTDETFDFWKIHTTVPAVAEARKLTESTIYGHMLKLVILGKVSSDEVLGEKLNREIREVLLFHPEKANSEIFELTEGKYSFEQLRIVRAGME
jgi:nucleoside-triphosphatase THEP1